MSTESSFDTQAANDKIQRYHKSESETLSAAAITNAPRDHTDESYEQRPMTGAGDIEARYDQHAKYLLGHRIVLAHILAEVIEDFRDMHPKEIMPYIDREVHIGTVPAEPGQTNAATDTAGARIVGLNTENSELCEGKIFFDVLFYLYLPVRHTKAIVDVEAQKDEPTSYRLLHREIFYLCRLISSQKERDFTGMHFNDILQTYSIWICMNMDEDFTEHIYLDRRLVLGSHQSKGRMDIPNIFVIGLATAPPALSEPDPARRGLHRLLRVLFSPVLTKTQKFKILREEYGIGQDFYDTDMIDTFRKEVDAMCNLSQGVKEYGIKIGRKEGYIAGSEETLVNIILRSFQQGFTVENISSITDMSIEKIKEVIREELHVRT